MITLDTVNYFAEISKVNFSDLPDSIKEGHEFLKDATENGQDWTIYHDDNAIRETIDIYLSKLNKLLKKRHSPVKSVPATKAVKTVVPKAAPAKKNTPPPAADQQSPSFTERIPEELRFIRRFINLNGKTKQKDDILRFVNALQRAILEKRIRKTSPYAKEIIMVQSKLIELHNTMPKRIKIELKPGTLKALGELVQGEKVMPAITLLKKYLNMHGKPGMKEKAGKLVVQFNRAVAKKTITEGDPYANVLKTAYENLKSYVKNKTQKTLLIEKGELRGLNGLLNGIEGLQGVEETEGVQVMNSMDFVNMKFEKLGFTGKWRELIGDPSPGFTAMVYGKPKLGKSYLCVDFAGYLARNHGRVLYVAKEEGINSTLQDKLNEKDVRHPNLTVASGLPTDLSNFDFIFLDSVTRLNLEPEDLEHLKALWPGKSFIYVFQTTKMGNFRGAQGFQHNVDIVIEVPEKGKAVQMGRFNQGGEMQIFNQAA